MQIVTIEWISDEIVMISVDDNPLIEVNHDEHGWSGMSAVIELTRALATALGARVADKGTPNL